MDSRVPTFSSVSEQLREFQSITEETFKHCTNMCLDIQEYGADLPTEFTELKNSMIDIARLHREGKALYAATVEIKSAMVESDLEDESDAQKKFQEILNECIETEEIHPAHNVAIDAVENCLKACLKEQQASDSSDEGNTTEVFVTETMEKYLDPLTKQIMKDPVKSRVCNHSYERDSIMKFLQKPRRCPNSGCTSMLRREDLVEDLELKKKLLSMK